MPRVLRMPPARRVIVDSLVVGERQHPMHGLLEVDVTLARRRIGEQRERGVDLSFTAWVAGCLGRACGREPLVHAGRDLLGRLVLFDQVDIATLVEVEVDGHPHPVPCVLRRTDTRDTADLSREIRAIQASGARQPGSARRWLSLIPLVPAPLRRGAMRLWSRLPRSFQREAGSLSLTAVGMFGGGPAWGISAPSLHPLTVVVGGISVGTRWRDGVPEPREILHLTVSLDHDVIDGAPAARFVKHLTSALESADGLSASDRPPRA